jgi:hypothetical protein
MRSPVHGFGGVHGSVNRGLAEGTRVALSRDMIANLTQMLRNVEFAFVGFCADESVRIGCRGDKARCLQIPAGHKDYDAAVALAKIADDDDFESAVMGWLFAGGR